MQHVLKKFYQTIHARYDLINHLMTLGLDSVWRRKAVKLAQAREGERWLDMCSGTGETAFLMKRLRCRAVDIVSADFSLPMLQHLKTRQPDRSRIKITSADASCLPFQSDIFDGIIITFATRNLSFTEDFLEKCLDEFHRVLKPGGRLINLETSQPQNRLIKRLFHGFANSYSKQVARLFSGAPEPYGFLAASMTHFFTACEYASILERCTFHDVKYQRLMFGAVAVHTARK